MPHTSRKHYITPPEQLELRILPTVKVNFNEKNGLLKITGDNEGNRVDVEGFGTPGNVEVFVDGNSVGQFTGLKNIKANLKGGNDLLVLEAFQFSGNVTAKFGSGADELDMDNAATAVNEVLDIGGFLKADLGNDPGDFVELDDEIRILLDVTLLGVADVDFDGDGTTRNFEPGDITFFSDLTIKFSGFGDTNGDGLEFDCDNLNVSGTTLLDGSNNAENIELTDCRFQIDFNADLNGGDDFINMNNGAADSSRFLGIAIFDGGAGNDTFLLGNDNSFLDPETVLNFETVV